MVRTQDFFERLRDAFPEKPLDFRDALTGGTDDGEFRNAVAGKSWTELDPALVGRRSDVLSFLQAQYFVQVLPAFLRSLVQDGDYTGVSDTLLVVLDWDQTPRLAQIAAHLTDTQREIVAEVLELFASTATGRQAAAATHVFETWRRQG